MKKIFVITLGLLMLCAIQAGCGGGGGVTPSPTPPADNVQTFSLGGHNYCWVKENYKTHYYLTLYFVNSNDGKERVAVIVLEDGIFDFGTCKGNFWVLDAFVDLRDGSGNLCENWKNGSELGSLDAAKSWVLNQEGDFFRSET